jgi:hypothetical protein
VKISIILIGIAFSILLLGSCGKETQSTTQGGGVFKVRVTIDPPLQPGVSSPFLSNSVNIIMAGNIRGWNGGLQTVPLSTLETDEISVTSGQNVQLFITDFSNIVDRNCRTVKYEAIQNGKINEVHIVSLGYNGSSSLCADGVSVSKNFIMN